MAQLTRVVGAPAESNSGCGHFNLAATNSATAPFFNPPLERHPHWAHPSRASERADIVAATIENRSYHVWILVRADLVRGRVPFPGKNETLPTVPENLSA